MSLARSSFKRKVIERAPRAPITPIVGCRGVYRPAGDAVVAAVPKSIIHRSEAYRRYVAGHECFFCRLVGYSQAAHENMGKALQGKVCDSRTFPACAANHGLAGCHYMFDNYTYYSREESRAIGAKFSALMRERAMREGWRFTEAGIVKP